MQAYLLIKAYTEVIPFGNYLYSHTNAKYTLSKPILQAVESKRIQIAIHHSASFTVNETEELSMPPFGETAMT